jgi:UDP-N-acetylglucosamine:LPS N-acetylglucosamine transferase
VLIQDEYWDTLFSSLWDPNTRESENSVIITDFVKLETPSLNPINRLVLGYANRMLKGAFLKQKLRIFADDETSLPQNNRVRSWVGEKFVMIGPIVEELPCESKDELRKELFTKKDNQKFVVFSLGGTSIARPLVDFLVQSAGWLSEKLGVQLVLLSGPRIDVASIRWDKNKALTVIPFTLDAMKYFKASVCVVTQAGASTLNEVASIGIPCVSIPIKGH